MRWSSTILALLVASGCIQDELVACDDGRLCPAGSVCTATSCADRAAVDACIGVNEGAACASPGLEDGVCATGVCTVRGCGNGTVDDDSSEACDDGNTVSGDGCTSTCEIEGCGNGRPDGIETCDDGNLTSHDGCSLTCQREVPQWTTTERSVDDEREGAAVAFIPARGRITRFGGYDVYGGIRGGTAELFDDRWARIATVHTPQARSYPASAFDSARQRWVVFGGMSSSGALADTWEFDGTDWTNSVAAGPPPGSHAMTYDASGSRIVMFCEDGTTWTFDGVGWTALAIVGPSPRSGAALAYDPIGARVVLYGGHDTVDLADTWALTGTTWSQVAATGSPSARAWHSLAFDPGLGAIVLQGDDVDTWLLQGGVWSPLSGTQGRFAFGLGLAYDGVRGRLVRYGGCGGSSFVLDDLYELDTGGWQRIGAPSPLDRSGGMLATDTKRNRIVMYGGQSWVDGDFDDTWVYDDTGWHELAPPTRPYADSYGGLAYDVARDRMVAKLWDETWEFDGSDWSKVTSAVSTPTGQIPIVYDVKNARVVAVRNGTTYVYDGTDWSPLAVNQTPPGSNCYDCVGTYDSDRDRVMLFDRTNLWELDGATWTDLGRAPFPEIRYRVALGYDPIRHRVVLVGGNTSSNGKQNDTWEWDGAAWTQVVTTGTYTPREFAHLAWSPPHGGFMMFGGNDRDITMHDTWLLRWDPLP